MPFGIKRVYGRPSKRTIKFFSSPIIYVLRGFFCPLVLIVDLCPLAVGRAVVEARGRAFLFWTRTFFSLVRARFNCKRILAPFFLFNVPLWGDPQAILLCFHRTFKGEQCPLTGGFL